MNFLFFWLACALFGTFMISLWTCVEVLQYGYVKNFVPIRVGVFLILLPIAFVVFFAAGITQLWNEQ